MTLPWTLLPYSGPNTRCPRCSGTKVSEALNRHLTSDLPAPWRARPLEWLVRACAGCGHTWREHPRSRAVLVAA